MPVGTEFDDFLVEVSRYSTANGDNYALAAIGGLALLEVGNDVVSDGLESLGRANNRFNFGLVGFGLLGGNAGHHKLAQLLVEYGKDLSIYWVELPEWLLNRAENCDRIRQLRQHH